MSEGKPTKNYLRLAGRIWSVLVLAVILFVFIMQIVGSEESGSGPLPWTEWLMIAFFPVGVLISLAMSWKWELWGGIAALGCCAIFFTLMCITRQRFVGEMLLPVLLAAGPGILFILSATRANQEAAAS